MTTNAMRLDREPSIRLVSSEDAAGFGSSVRNGVRTFFGKIAGFFSSAWNWLKRTLHLDAVGDRVAGAYRWAKVQGGKIVALLGPDGLLGAGLLAVSTSAGRSALGFVLRPVGWLLDLVAKGYTWVERALANKSKGGVRNWISDRMRSGREFLFGEPNLTVVGSRSVKKDRKIGVVNTAILWFAKTFSSIVAVDSVPMRLARTLGTFLLGRRSVLMLALVPLGAFANAVMAVATIGVIAAAWMPWHQDAKDVWSKFRKETKDAGTQAAKIVEATEADLKADTEVAAEVIAEQDGVKAKVSIPLAANRDARRGTSAPAKQSPSRRAR